MIILTILGICTVIGLVGYLLMRHELKKPDDDNLYWHPDKDKEEEDK